MNIEKGIYTRLQHFLSHPIHLWAEFQCRREPFTIQIRAFCIGTQITAHTAVGIHIRHNVKYKLLEQFTAHAMLHIQQSIQNPFDKPLGHALTRMLTRGDPNILFALCGFAHTNQIQSVTVGRNAQTLN